jgi:hypothetical protein
MRSALLALTIALSPVLGACDGSSVPLARAQEGSGSALPRAVRPGVKAAMSRHAEQASTLTVSVALGSYEQTIEHVNTLLSEPRPAPPMADDLSSLNQILPARLFELDDAFRSALVKLRTAAETRDDELSITRLGAVVRACRNCHRNLRSAAPAPHPR